MKRKIALALCAPVMLPVVAQAQAYGGRYTPCVNYFVVGESPCQPVASTPVAAPAAVNTPLPPSNALQTAQPPKSEVDIYLENYGKPPREFVEFYLRPTAENAMKWVTTYNNLMQKSQALSRSWSQADELYNAARAKGVNPLSLVSGSAVRGYNLSEYALSTSHTEALTTAADQQAVQMAEAVGKAEVKNQPVHLGAFAEGGDQAVEMAPVHLTYFFSATCPYCVKMTSELSNLFKEMKGKLTLTCVDVTPLSASHKPDPANVEGKLPCAWRTPKDGEVESVPVMQTPTMLIARKGMEKPVRLSGYVPATTLMVYLTGASVSPVGASTVPVMGQFR